MTAGQWPKTPAEARALQEDLRNRVIAEDRLGPVRLLAGVDAGYDLRRGMTRAVAVSMEADGLVLRHAVRAERPTDFPYVPGLLSFREAPAILAALDRLPERPDLLLVDGQGRAHPRRFGLACHLGVLADLPTIGVAKSRLVGTHDEPGEARGARSPLLHKGEMIGVVLRTRARVRPVFVSVGHRISLETAVELVLAAAPRYRLPEPIREADRLTRRAPDELERR